MSAEDASLRPFALAAASNHAGGTVLIAANVSRSELDGEVTLSRVDIRERLVTGKPMVLDGAMGSELQRRGVWVSHGATADKLGAWSATAMRDAPGVVRQVHEDYFKAGADIATTNSFWTNSVKLS